MERSSGRCLFGALAVAAVMSFASVAPGVELVVGSASTSANVADDEVPEIGAFCAAALKTLRAAGYRITDVQGGSSLSYTVEREAKRNRPGAVVIIVCIPQGVDL